MVLIDMKMPNGCIDCAAMRCQMCIICDSKKVADYVFAKVSDKKPLWCPIIDEVSDVEELKHE